MVGSTGGGWRDWIGAMRWAGVSRRGTGWRALLVLLRRWWRHVVVVSQQQLATDEVEGAAV